MLFRLEDHEAEEVKEFVEEQAEVTNSVLDKYCDVVNEKLRETITKLANFPRYDAPFKRRNNNNNNKSKYFYVGNTTGLQDQNLLFMQVPVHHSVHHISCSSSLAFLSSLLSLCFFCQHQVEGRNLAPVPQLDFRYCK